MGLGGNPGHLETLEKVLKKQLKEGALVHRAKSNSGFKTMDGAALGANRIVEELLELLIKLSKEGVRIVKISIIGYSFGGIVARYAIGILYNMGFFKTVEPCIFATFATPHAGSIFPSPKLQYRILNSLGLVMLGLTGKDLFLANNVLEDLANPSLDYFKGLALFKHHILFANAVSDRTVPFWTSYLTNKSPFKDSKHMELKFYDHLYGVSTEGVTEAGRVPFLVDMKASKYNKDVVDQSSVVKASEKFRRMALLSLLPIFLPILLTLLTVGTIHSHVKYGAIYKTMNFEHPKLFKKLTDSLAAGRSNSQDNDLNKLERKLNEDLASVAGNAMEDILVDTQNPGYENIKPSQITRGKPKAANSFSGLVDDSPWDLNIDIKSQRIIDNLNSIKWDKYAAKLLEFNTHRDIVDRSSAKGQGAELMNFFGRIVVDLLANNAEEDLI